MFLAGECGVANINQLLSRAQPTPQPGLTPIISLHLQYEITYRRTLTMFHLVHFPISVLDKAWIKPSLDLVSDRKIPPSS